MSKISAKAVAETPPRTWRRPDDGWRSDARSGNTSTDVEKTGDEALDGVNVEKHLHGRGEDANVPSMSKMIAETPPRTWRRPKQKLWMSWNQRNTSTDVEKTFFADLSCFALRKHLHGRGEDRARAPACPPQEGNTSTDVEKTE